MLILGNGVGGCVWADPLVRNRGFHCMCSNTHRDACHCCFCVEEWRICVVWLSLSDVPLPVNWEDLKVEQQAGPSLRILYEQVIPRMTWKFPT